MFKYSVSEPTWVWLLADNNGAYEDRGWPMLCQPRPPMLESLSQRFQTTTTSTPATALGQTGRTWPISSLWYKTYLNNRPFLLGIVVKQWPLIMEEEQRRHSCGRPISNYGLFKAKGDPIYLALHLRQLNIYTVLEHILRAEASSF